MHTSAVRRAALLPVLVLAALACHSSEPAAPAPVGKPEPYVPLPDEAPQTIGYFLTVFDRSLAQWTELKLSATSPRQQSTLALLEQNMQKRARERREALLTELETGAPLNRRVAAAAHGFTHDPTVLGPLVAALADPDAEVVQRALLALGVLALRETPMAPIRYHLLNDGDAWTRSNAAFALLGIANAGNGTSELAESCRAGLADADAGVRAQCASALGAAADPTAVAGLGELLLDDASLVSLASALALARIGREHAEQKGTTARALVGALDQVPSERRASLLGALRWLSDSNLGDETAAWREWAYKLP